jgi:hypothetical protein
MCPPWHLVDTKMDNVKDEMNNKSHNILKLTGSHIKYQCSIASHCSGHRIHKPVRLNHILLCMSDSGALIMGSGFLRSLWLIFLNEASTRMVSQICTTYISPLQIFLLKSLWTGFTLQLCRPCPHRGFPHCLPFSSGSLHGPRVYGNCLKSGGRLPCIIALGYCGPTE